MSENILSINESGHAERILRRLDSMRKEEKNCDFVISVEGRKLHVNSDVICAASDYFDAMFLHDTKEKQKGFVEMRDVQFSAVEKCINFIYSGKLIASENECEELLFCAGLMQLNEVCDKISPFLEGCLSVKSFFNIRTIAAKFSLLTLNTACDEFASDKLLELSEEEDFLEFDEAYVTFLLASEKSSDTFTEDSKLKIALRWINSNLENRSEYLMQFVKILEISKLTAEYARFLVQNEPLCLRFPEFMKELFIGMTNIRQDNTVKPSDPTHALSSLTTTPADTQHTDSSTVTDVWIPATGFASHSNITGLSPSAAGAGAGCRSLAGVPSSRFDSGSQAASSPAVQVANSLILFDESKHFVHLYRPSEDKLTLINGYRNEMKTSSHFTACVFQSYLYVFHRSKNVFRLNIHETDPSWNQSTSLLHDHDDGLQCTVHENYIYVGGKNKMERYRIGAGRYYRNRGIWEDINVHGTTCHHSALVSCNEDVFVIGGKYRGDSLAEVNKFSHSSSRWNLVPRMKIARKDASAAVLEGKIYVAGGQNKVKLSDFEMYDCASNSWTILSNMASSRSSFRLCVLANQICAVGDSSVVLDFHSMESYDPDFRKWAVRCLLPRMDIWAPATVSTYMP